MLKRVERKRKRREEVEEPGLDQETMVVNATDSDESDSSSERESTLSDDLDGNDGDQEDEATDEGPSVSVGEALKDPIYLISLHPTVYGCVLCKGKIIKNAGMSAAHKNANAHQRRLKHFKLLSVNADPHSSARELVKAMHSTLIMQKTESQELSKRALKRQARQAALREKRKRHKELKAKVIEKNPSKKLPTADRKRTAPSSVVNSRSSSESPTQPEKKTKLESNNLTTEVQLLRTKTSSSRKKLAHKSRPKSIRKAKN